MKAIILAAGEGTRLSKYTKDIPKGMLEIAGKTLLQHQIDIFRNNGITDITIVTGHKAEKIKFEGIKTVHNPDYADTNMIYSLMCAAKDIDEDIIVSYSDIIFEDEVLKDLLEVKGNIVVTIDESWKYYWDIRDIGYKFDTENLELNLDSTIKTTGGKVEDINKVHHRFIGLLKFSASGLFDLKQACLSDDFTNAYMTDILQYLIDNGTTVNSHIISNGWLEFDTDHDYELMGKLYKEGKLDNLIDL